MSSCGCQFLSFWYETTTTWIWSTGFDGQPSIGHWAHCTYGQSNHVSHSTQSGFEPTVNANQYEIGHSIGLLNQNMGGRLPYIYMKHNVTKSLAKTTCWKSKSRSLYKCVQLYTPYFAPDKLNIYMTLFSRLCNGIWKDTNVYNYIQLFIQWFALPLNLCNHAPCPGPSSNHILLVISTTATT